MNKKNIIIKAMAVLLLWTGLTSCDDYLDVNTDPNNPTEVTPELVLPVGQTYTAYYIQGDRRASHLGNMFMYNWSESYGFSWYNDEFQYLVTTTFYQALFDQAYTRALKQYNILTQLEGIENNNYVAIGKIMKAYHFQLLVDFYGDIPYFEALGRSTNATPTYNSGQEVYDDLLVQLTEAIALIKAADETTLDAVNDVMFAGDMTEWIKFANSLKVRILTRLSGTSVAGVANASKITTELAAIEAEGSGFITSDVLVAPGYLQEENKQNPLWEDFGQGPDGSDRMNFRATAATQFQIDLLTANNDPRIGALYEEVDGGFLGVDQIPEPGDEYHYTLVSNIGPGILKAPTMGGNIFSLAENNFNLAELALKNLYTGDDAQSLYEAGIEASFAYLEVDGADDYYSQDIENVGWDVASNPEEQLEAIITQKWWAVNGITAEQSWFDYSRTGYPENLPVAEEASTSDRPVRLFYPASEKSSNAANVPAQPNAFTEKIFWAK